MTEDVASEEAVIAAILIDGNRLADCAFLRPEDFHYPGNRAIYEEMQAMPGGVDLYRLSKRPNLDAAYMQHLLESTKGVKSRNVEYYARAVKDASTLRKLKRLCMETDTAIMRGQDAWVVMEEFERASTAISMDTISEEEPTAIGPAAQDAVDHFRRLASGEMVNGHQTHLSALNDLLGGLRPADLDVVAARTSCGKSAFLANLADHLGKTGVPVLFLSLEMSVEAMAQRLVQIRGAVETKKLKWKTSAATELHNAQEAATSMQDDPVTLAFCKHRTISAIKSRARRWAAKNKNGVILVDYLQRITPGAHSQKLNRYQQVGEASAGLKDIGIELQCPVVVAAQLGRGAEKEKGHGMMAHLRESGDIEQDADAVIILAPLDAKEAKAANLAADVICVCLAKNRNGQTGNIFARFDKMTQRIMDTEGPQRKPTSPARAVVSNTAFDPIEYDEETWADTPPEELLF